MIYSPHAAVDFDPETADGLAAEQVNSVERRRSDREARHTPAWVSGPTGSPATAGRHVMVTDLSLHGVGFKSDRPMKRGDACWMVIAGPTLRLSTRVRVVNCREESGKFVLGAEFF